MSERTLTRPSPTSQLLQEVGIYGGGLTLGYLSYRRWGLLPGIAVGVIGTYYLLVVAYRISEGKWPTN